MDFNFIKSEFGKIYGTEVSPRVFFSPGRINLIGEHIDYNGGFVFPAALTIGIAAAATPRTDGVVRLRSLNADGEIVFNISDNLVKHTADGWGNYPKGVIAWLKNKGYTLPGADLLFYGNLPDGAGLSSSAAIEVLTGYLFLTLAGIENIDRVWLAKLCQSVENNFIGVNCGIMDQFAVANGREGQAIQLDCNTLKYVYAPFSLGNYVLVIMNTNKRRELADSKYNERRAECDRVLAILQQHYNYQYLVEAGLDDLNRHIADPVLFKRAYHVITENQRVLEAMYQLKMGYILGIGQLLNLSHASLRDAYEVTGKELDSLASAAQTHPACAGARMTGAGFGGCAIALVQAQALDDFTNFVGARYKNETGLTADFYISHIGDGVKEIG